MKNKDTLVKIIFAIRMVLWLGAAAATAYWIRFSFLLYQMGFEDEHQYATALRPVFYKGVLIAIACVCLSFIFRSISDRIKKKYNLR